MKAQRNLAIAKQLFLARQKNGHDSSYFDWLDEQEHMPMMVQLWLILRKKLIGLKKGATNETLHTR